MTSKVSNEEWAKAMHDALLDLIADAEDRDTPGRGTAIVTWASVNKAKRAIALGKESHDKQAR